MQPRCTANCPITVRMVYTLNMLGRGRCLDRVVRGLDLKEDSGVRLLNNDYGVPT
jgi:hypothetical protein